MLGLLLAAHGTGYAEISLVNPAVPMSGSHLTPSSYMPCCAVPHVAPRSYTVNGKHISWVR